MKALFFSLCAMALLLILGLVSCWKRSAPAGQKYGPKTHEDGPPEYHFAVYPLHNPTKLFELYQPLMDYLNARLNGPHLILEASRDYAAFQDKFQARKPEFLLPNPVLTVQAMKFRYHVIASMGEPSAFKGLFIVRKDTPLSVPTDLKGKAVSYPAPTAVAACLLQQYFLHQNGIDVNRDIENRYVGSQESSIMNAYLAKTAAAATWMLPWKEFQRDHPREAAELKIMWETEPLINNSIMVRDDVSVEVRDRVQRLLADLGTTEEGKTILARMQTPHFIRATDTDYDRARTFLETFEKEVRRVVEK